MGKKITNQQFLSAPPAAEGALKVADPVPTPPPPASLTDGQTFLDAVPSQFKGPNAQSARLVEVLFALLEGPYGLDGEGIGLFDLAEQGATGASELLERVLQFLTDAQGDESEPLNDNFLAALFQLTEALGGDGGAPLSEAAATRLLNFFDAITSADSDDGVGISNDELAELKLLSGQETQEAPPELPGDRTSNLIPKGAASSDDDAATEPTVTATSGGSSAAGGTPDVSVGSQPVAAAGSPPEETPSSTAPTPAAPAPATPTSAAPTPVAPTPATPPSAAPTPAAPTPTTPTSAAPTPAAPAPVAPTPVAPTPVAPTPAAPTPAAPASTTPTSAAPPPTTPTEPTAAPLQGLSPNPAYVALPPLAPEPAPEVGNVRATTTFQAVGTVLERPLVKPKTLNSLTFDNDNRHFIAEDPTTGTSHFIERKLKPSTGASVEYNYFYTVEGEEQGLDRTHSLASFGADATFSVDVGVDIGVRPLILSGSGATDGSGNFDLQKGSNAFASPYVEVTFTGQTKVKDEVSNSPKGYSGRTNYIKFRTTQEFNAGSKSEIASDTLFAVTGSVKTHVRVDIRFGTQSHTTETDGVKREIWLRFFGPELNAGVEFGVNEDGDPVIEAASADALSNVSVAVVHIWSTKTLFQTSDRENPNQRKWSEKVVDFFGASINVSALTLDVDPDGTVASIATNDSPAPAPSPQIGLETSDEAVAEQPDAIQFTEAPLAPVAVAEPYDTSGSSESDPITIELNTLTDLAPPIPEIQPELIAFIDSIIEPGAQIYDLATTAWEAVKALSTGGSASGVAKALIKVIADELGGDEALIDKIVDRVLSKAMEKIFGDEPIDLGDPVAVAERLVEALTDPGLVAEAAMEVFSEHFTSWEGLFDTVLAAIEKALIHGLEQPGALPGTGAPAASPSGAPPGGAGAGAGAGAAGGAPGIAGAAGAAGGVAAGGLLAASGGDEGDDASTATALHPTDWDHKFSEDAAGNVHFKPVEGDPAFGSGNGLTLSEWWSALVAEDAVEDPSSGDSVYSQFTQAGSALGAWQQFSGADGILSDHEIETMISEGYLVQKEDGSWFFDATKYQQDFGPLTSVSPPAAGQPSPVTVAPTAAPATAAPSTPVAPTVAPTTPTAAPATSVAPTPTPAIEPSTPVSRNPELATPDALIAKYDLAAAGAVGHGSLNLLEFTMMLVSRKDSMGEDVTGMSPQITAMFQRFDVNDDGVIGAWELKAMLDAGEIIVFDGLTVSPAVVGLSTQPHEVVENDEPPEPLDPFGLITPVLDTTVDVLQDVTDSVV